MLWQTFDDVLTHQEQGGELYREHMERLYVFALMWSVGALLELDDRMKLERWLRHHDNIRLDLPNIPPHSEDTMFDFYVTNDGIIHLHISFFPMWHLLYFSNHQSIHLSL